MAFVQRPDGLVDVDTPMGPMPMAPDVAMQLGWVPGDAAPGMPPVAPPPMQPGATAQLSQGDREVLGLNQSHVPQPMVDQLDAVIPERQKPTDPTKIPPRPAGAATVTAAPTEQATPQRQGPTNLEIAQSLSGATTSSASSRSGPAPVTGQRRQEMDASLDAQLAAANKAATAEGALADMATEQAQLAAGQAHDLARAEAARRVEMDRRLADLQAKREASRRAVPDTLDEGRWDKTGGFGQVLAAVSLMLGGISQGITGRENPARGIINDIIARGIEAQREEIRQAELLNEDARNEYADALAMYGDPILAELQLQMNGQEAVKKELAARMQGAQGEQVKALAAQGIAEQEGEIARIRNEMDGRAQTVTTQSQSQSESPADAQKRMMLAKAADEAQNDPFAGMNDASIRDATARRIRLRDGTDVYAPSQSNAKEYLMVQEAFQQYAANMERIKEIMRTGGNVNPKSATYKELNGLIMDNALAVKNKEGLGALVGADWDIVDALSGKDAASWTDFDEATEIALDAMVEITRKKLEEKTRQMSMHPTKMVPYSGGEKRPGASMKW